MIDHGIADRFIVACQSANDAASIPCQVDDMNITGRIILLPYGNNLLGKGIVFRISYSYASCGNNAVITATGIASYYKYLHNYIMHVLAN